MLTIIYLIEEKKASENEMSINKNLKKKLPYRVQWNTMWLLQILRKYCHVGKASYRQYVLLNITHHSRICVQHTFKLIKEALRLM